MLWQRFWLDLCTKQVVSARACANQFLPYSSSGIALFGMRTVQADSFLNSEQINTLFICVGGQEGGLGGGGHFGPEARNLHVTVMILYLYPPGCRAAKWSQQWWPSSARLFGCKATQHSTWTNAPNETQQTRIFLVCQLGKKSCQ